MASASVSRVKKAMKKKAVTEDFLGKILNTRKIPKMNSNVAKPILAGMVNDMSQSR